MIFSRKQVSQFAPALFMLALGCTAGAQSYQDANASQATSPEKPAIIRQSLDVVETAAQLDALRSRLDNHSSLLRVQAVTAIDASVTFDAEASSRILGEEVDDKDPLVAEAALRALLVRGIAQVRESDLDRFPGETKELGEIQIGSRSQDTSALRERMRNGDAQAQQAAFEALASIDTPGAIDALKEEFADPTSLHRLQTLELVLRNPYTNAPAVLQPILASASKDEDPLVKERAVVLLRQESSDTLPDLQSSTTHP